MGCARQRRGAASRIDAAKRLAASGRYNTMKALADASGVHESTLRRHDIAPCSTPQLADAPSLPPPAHALLDQVPAGGALPEEALPETPAGAHALWLPPTDVSDYLDRLDAPGQPLGGVEHFTHWRGTPPEPDWAESCRRNLRRRLKVEARAVADGTEDPYPKGLADDTDRDNDDCRRAVGDLERRGERFGADDIVSAVMQRRRALLGRRAAKHPAETAVRREMLRQLVHQDAFQEFYQPGCSASSSAISAAHDRAEAMIAAAGL